VNVEIRNPMCKYEGKGLRYKSFVDGQAASLLFIGYGWFVYQDQAVPGRKDGENFNLTGDFTVTAAESASLGLLNQQDQPYKDRVDIMRTVNAGPEKVHNGKVV
jgi:hypothetical protein